MAQPEGFGHSSKPTHICRLKRALYGLKQAPCAWFDQLKNVLLSWNFKNSE